MEKKETKETKEVKLSPYEQVILAEMERRAKEGDTLLADALQSKDKSIQECFEYVVLQAKKQADEQQCAMVEDSVVYGWSHHYYIEKKEVIDAELRPKVDKTATPTAKTAKTSGKGKKKTYSNPLLSASSKKRKTKKTAEPKEKERTIKKGGQTITFTELTLF